MQHQGRLRMVCTDDGSLAVYEVAEIAGAQDRQVVYIDSQTYQYLGWWTQDSEECSDTSANQATALIVQKLEDLGYEHIDYQAVYRVIRRVCDVGPPIMKRSEVEFSALWTRNVPDPPARIVFEVWATAGDGTFQKFDSPTALETVWHARRMIEMYGVGTHVHIVAHSSAEYMR